MNVLSLFLLLTISGLISAHPHHDNHEHHEHESVKNFFEYNTFFSLHDNEELMAYCLIAFPDLHNTHHFFETVALELPSVLTKIVREKKPLIITVPEHIHLLTPLAEFAPYNEGIRVAMAWASAYYRFAELGNLDVRFLTMPEQFTIEELLYYCYELSQAKIIDNLEKSPEYCLQKRQFSPKQLKNPSLLKSKKINVKQYLYEYKNKQKRKFSTHLPRLEKGQRRIVITGGAGFLGSHLTKDLLNKGHQVIVLDNMACCLPDNLNEFKDHKNLRFYEFDVTNFFTFDEAITDILHLASLPSPQFYYAKPIETLMSGLQATKNCLELAREKKARFLFSSTSEVYGDPLINPQPEDYPGNVNPIGKRSQYDESKRGAETLIKLYYDRYKIDARIVRIFNTYGPHMMLNDGRVVTNFMQAVLENKSLIINGDGNQTRSFAYYSDTIDGILRVFESNNFHENMVITDRVFNVGNDSEFTINELAEKTNCICQRKFNKSCSLQYQPQPDATDPKQRRPDLTRIHQTFGYQPSVSLEEGIERMLEYFMRQNIV